MTEKLLKILSELDSFTAMKGEEFLLRKRNQFDTNIPLVVYEIKDKEAVKNKINLLFGNVETEEGEDYIITKPIDVFDKERFTYGDLVEIIWRLRDPDGCPWDKVQTPQTIRTNIIEEAYELIEAIDLNDEAKIREECGDVLLQGTFCSVMTEEKGTVSNVDVISELCKKLINRHTHIFGKDKAGDAEQALMFWDKAKAKEKGQKSVCDKLDSVPITFTALQRANKVQKIIKKTGFDFPTEKEAVDKIYEEVGEFIASTGNDREKEAGDMLFSVVNVLRMNDIDPEVALNGTTKRFESRFRYVVEQAKVQGKKVEEMTLEEMDALYNEAKKAEKK